jgi:hypothetical protein
MGRSGRPHTDLTGHDTNGVTAIRYIGGGKWLCRCKCGTEWPVSTYRLTHVGPKQVKSCKTCRMSWVASLQRERGLPRRRQAAEMREAGKTLVEIAKAISVSKERARQLLLPFGYKKGT